MISFRHAWASVREVVRPLVVGGLPYVVAGGVVVGLAGYIWFGSGDEGGDGPLGEEHYSESDGQAVTFAEALFLVESGDVDGGREAMRLLAPLAAERMGDPEAHDWLARDLLGLGEEEKKVPSRDSLVEARGHLVRLVDGRIGGPDVVARLVQVHLALKEPDSAVTLLDENAMLFPELHLLGARVAASLNRPAIRERNAVAASAYFKKASEDETLAPKEQVKAKLGLAAAEGLLGRFEKMRELARSLSADESGKERLLLQSWLGTIQQGIREGRPVAETLAQLSEALEEVGMKVRLIELAAALGAQDPAGVEIGKIYESLAAVETVDVAVLVPLGSLAVALGKREEGLKHLEQAVALAPDHVVALNNLAFGLAERGGLGDVEQALEMVDRAVGAAGKQGGVLANCWETRGQILAKLGRWREAVVDLERALRQMSGSKPVHATLGLAYRELGQEALAEEHLRLAKKD